jgi:hypothetical protein
LFFLWNASYGCSSTCIGKRSSCSPSDRLGKCSCWLLYQIFSLHTILKQIITTASGCGCAVLISYSKTLLCPLYERLSNVPQV